MRYRTNLAVGECSLALRQVGRRLFGSLRISWRGPSQVVLVAFQVRIPEMPVNLPAGDRVERYSVSAAAWQGRSFERV